MKNTNKLTKSNRPNFNSKPVKTSKSKPIKIKIRARGQSNGGSFWDTLFECVCPQSK